MFDSIKEYLLNDTADHNAFHRTIFQLIVISSITVIVFLNSLQNGFVIDDRTYVINWKESHNIKNLPNLLINGPWPKEFARIEYRPVKATIQVIDYQLFKDNPFGYHLQALIIHMIATIFIYLITKLIFKKRSIAFIASLLFGIHPIHTEAVNFITASTDTLAMCFMFISFYFYLMLEEYKKHYKLYYFISIFFAFFAFFGYELTLILLILIILYDICFKKINKVNLRNKLYIYSSYFLLAIVFFVIRFRFIGEINSSSYFANSIYLTALTMTKAFVRYLELMVFPINLSINQILPGKIESLVNVFDNFEPIKAQSIFDPNILFSIAVIFSLLALAFYSFKKRSIITFGVLWVFIAIAPVMNIIPIRQVMAERYFYIASFGPILLFACLFYFLYNYKYPKKYKELAQNSLILTLLLIIIIFSFLTIKRNMDWRSEETIWTSVAKQQIGGALGNYYVGLMYFQKTDYENAVINFNYAIIKKKDYKVAYYFLTLAYINQGNINSATITYNKLMAMSASSDASSLATLKKDLDSARSSVTNSQTSSSLTNKNYKSKDFSFTYPQNWSVDQSGDQINLANYNNNFWIDIIFSKLPNGTPVNNYINQQEKTYGTLVNQGLAQIPTVDYAYAKIWDDNSTQKIQFFLFRNNLVLEIIVWPSNSVEMKEFDKIISSLKFY